jgi:hypothetical protein
MELTLAGTDWLGDEETLRAQAEALAPDRDGAYRAADPTESIQVTVDHTAMLVDVKISRTWPERLTADRFTGALFDTYTNAVRAAMLAEVSNRDTAPVPPPIETIPTGLSDEEWERRVRAQLTENEAELAAVRQAEQGVPPADEEVRGRNGYLTLVLRGGGPVALTADPAVLGYADTERLSQDVLDVFAHAGLGVLQEEQEYGDFGFEED